MKIDVREMHEGHVVEIGDQSFLLWQEVAIETEAGKPSRLLAWESICAEPGCEEPFWFLSGGNGSVSFNRRCHDHRAPGVPVFRAEGVSRSRVKASALRDRIGELEAELATANAKIEALERGG